MTNIVQEIKNKGITKWKISKYVGVHWKTVHHWDKGFSSPNDTHMKKLKEMLESNI